MVQMVELYLAIGRCCCPIDPQTFLCQENIVFVEMDTSHLRKNRDGEIFGSKIQMILVYFFEKKCFENNVFWHFLETECELFGDTVICHSSGFLITQSRNQFRV